MKNLCILAVSITSLLFGIDDEKALSSTDLNETLYKSCIGLSVTPYLMVMPGLNVESRLLVSKHFFWSGSIGFVPAISLIGSPACPVINNSLICYESQFPFYAGVNLTSIPGVVSFPGLVLGLQVRQNLSIELKTYKFFPISFTCSYFF